MRDKDDIGPEERRANAIRIEKRDYVALAIAGLETVLLPLLILIGVLLVLLYLLR